MSKPKEGLIKADIGDIFESMESSFYWIQESLQRFQRQLESKPSLLEEFKQLESQPLDLIGKLKGIETEIVEFMRALEKTISSNRLEKTRLGLRVNSGDLKKKELAQLHHMNIQLAEITKGIETSAGDIGVKLEARLKDRSDRLSDYEIDAEFSFLLREDDPSFSDDHDNTLASRDLSIHKPTNDNTDWKFYVDDWEKGYEFDPFPHGPLFHELRYRDSRNGDSPSLGLRDILKVSDVWVDLVVRYQFYFDVVNSQWIKKTESGESDGLSTKTYVQPR